MFLVFFIFLLFFYFILFLLVASFDGLRPLLVTCHCQPFCSLANKLRSFVCSFVFTVISANVVIIMSVIMSVIVIVFMAGQVSDLSND